MSDLDARVAVLMAIFDTWNESSNPTARIVMERSIRAELQKPALHEPVSDQETIDAIHTHCFIVTAESMKDMRRTLESFLQDRAKPAQEEITENQLVLCSHCQFRNGCNAHGKCRIDYDHIRASKGEKT